MRRIAGTAVALIFLAAGAARADRSRMPAVMVVEVVALDAAITCGASARIITVERGTWSGETIALRWRACSRTCSAKACR